MPLGLTLGVELELLAPPGSSRLALAAALAGSGGTVEHRFHLDAEPSAGPGVGILHHLTPAFDVLDADGRAWCSLVDDVTLQDDLDREAPSLPGWYRIVSDDRRLLRLVQHRCDPGAPRRDVLQPLADAFGTKVAHRGGFAVVDDGGGATVALAATLPGERHRPCEVVTAPIGRDHDARLEAILGPARSLGFTVPSEAAVHLHVHADLVRSARVLRNLVRLLVPYADVLRWMVGTNPRCRRLGPLPEVLVDVVEAPGFASLPWGAVRERLGGIGLSKYADVNLVNVLDPPAGKDTLEWRILPGTLDAETVTSGAELFQAILTRAAADPAPPRHLQPVAADFSGVDALLCEVGHTAALGTWLGRQVLTDS